MKLFWIPFLTHSLSLSLFNYYVYRRKTVVFTRFVEEIIKTRHATAIVVHEPRVTIGQTVGPQVTSAQVFFLVRIQTVSFLGFHAYKTRSRQHFVAPHSYVAASAFSHHYSQINWQCTRILNHHLEINFEKRKNLNKIL